MTSVKTSPDCANADLNKTPAETAIADEQEQDLDFGKSADSKRYPFLGTHFLASYLNCNTDKLLDHKELMNALVQSIIGAGATILKTCQQPFPNGGFTAVILLAESHASLHCYPEHGSCFVDFFTCGQDCDHSKFSAILERYIEPKHTIKKIIVRSDQESEVNE